MSHKAYYARGDKVQYPFSTMNSSGASVSPTNQGTVQVRRLSDSAIRTGGITASFDVGGNVGVHHIEIDLDDDFYNVEGLYVIDHLGLVLEGVVTINKACLMFRVGPTVYPADMVEIDGDATAATALYRYFDGVAVGAVPSGYDEQQATIRIYQPSITGGGLARSPRPSNAGWDEFIGAIIIFTTGNCAGQSSVVNSAGQAYGYGSWVTFSPPLTEAPVGGDKFVLVPSRALADVITIKSEDADSAIADNAQAGAEAAIDEKFRFTNRRVNAAVKPTHSGIGGNGFQFGLSLSPAEPKVLAGESTDIDDETVLDATRRTTTYTTATIGTQWQLAIEVLQPDPSGSNPWIEFSSDNEAVATVNSEGIIEYVGVGSCTIIGTSAATEDSPSQTIRVEIVNSSSGGESIETVEYIADEFDAAKHLLVVYNADSADSESLKNHYLANRPGVSAANVLGLSGLPDATGTTAGNVSSLILDPIYTWLVANEAAKPIRYIVVMRGVPSRQGDNGSVGYMLYDLLDSRGHRSGDGYKGGESRFIRAQYQGATALASWIDMGSYAASRAYIDKLKTTSDAGGLQADGVTISGNAAGVGGDRWILDDKRTVPTYTLLPQFTDDQSGLQAEGIDAGEITYQPSPTGDLIAAASDVTFFGNWGIHSDVLANGWGNDGSVSFTGNSGWFALMTIESYNGIYGSSHGDPAEFFAAAAFGGSNYSNTPVCFVGHTAEPYVAGVSSQHYARRWARGWTAAEAAWAGRNTRHFLHVGDPLVVR